MEMKWVICPICKGKTRIMLREDTKLRNFPLFCPKCKRECIVNADRWKVDIVNLQNG